MPVWKLHIKLAAFRNGFTDLTSPVFHRRSPNTSHKQRVGRCWLLWALVWALVLSPLLGQMHRAAHATASAHTQHWLHALFPDHSPADCELLDQLSHGYAGPPAALSLTSVTPPGVVPLPAWQAPHDVATAVFFDPRAPPLLHL